MEIVIHAKKSLLERYDATDQHGAFELLTAEDANGNRFKIFSENSTFAKTKVSKVEQETA